MGRCVTEVWGCGWRCAATATARTQCGGEVWITGKQADYAEIVKGW